MDEKIKIIRRTVKRLKSIVPSAAVLTSTKDSEKYDRDTDDITIIAVTKTHPTIVIQTIVAAGIHEIGESRVQELTKRAAAVNEWLGRRPRDISAGAKPRPLLPASGRPAENTLHSCIYINCD